MSKSEAEIALQNKKFLRYHLYFNMHGGLSNKINVPEMINSLMIAVAFLALSGDGFYNKSSL